MKLDIVCRSDDSSAIKILASKSPLILQITMKHFLEWIFIGHPVDYLTKTGRHTDATFSSNSSKSDSLSIIFGTQN